MNIHDIAMVCHNVNKAYCASIGDNSQAEWELAPQWQRDSALAGVRAHVNSGLTMHPEDSHISWMNQKLSEGWKYGPYKDVENKEHPCMVPYNELPTSQQTKDYIFREVVHCLSNFL